MPLQNLRKKLKRKKEGVCCGREVWFLFYIYEINEICFLYSNDNFEKKVAKR